ncbi:MAG: YfcE family phosphodiesterase [Promethearchaeota archaeon]
MAIGDSHIPYRAKNIPEKILDKIDELTSDKLFDYIFFTGDIIKDPAFMKFLNSKFKKNIFIVIGNMDYYYGNKDAPVYQELRILLKNNDKLRIGLTHGAQIKPRGDRSQLERLTIERNYNILITGHTHKEEVFLTNNGILLINPGSVTGAWSFVASGIPSFIVVNLIELTKEIRVALFQLNSKTSRIEESNSYFIFKNNQIQYKF